MLDQLLPNDTFSILLVFARVGAAVMLLPGFGESYVTPRMRLMFAVVLSIVVTPIVAKLLPSLPANAIALMLLLAGEIVIGLFIGGLVRLLVTSLHVAGVVIGYHTSLANAMVFDPGNAQQGSVIGTFLNLLGVFLIFMSDLHHLMLMALTDSYALFVPGLALPVGDFSDLAAQWVAQSFSVGLRIAAPFVVVGLVFYIGLGLLARLMPQVQVFFVAMPLQVMLGFFILMLVLSASMTWFLQVFQDGVLSLAPNL